MHIFRLGFLKNYTVRIIVAITHWVLRMATVVLWGFFTCINILSWGNQWNRSQVIDSIQAASKWLGQDSNQEYVQSLSSDHYVIQPPGVGEGRF